MKYSLILLYLDQILNAYTFIISEKHIVGQVSGKPALHILSIYMHICTRRQKMTEAGEPKSRYYLMIYYFSIGALLVYIVSCIWGKNYLYADGAGYFYNMLANDNFQLWPDGRIFSQILMQFFSVNAMNIGVTSVRVIGALFGFGATFWTGLFYVLSMRLCLKRNRPEYMAMISMMLCLLLAFTGFFTQIESSVTVAVFCYMFFHFLLYDEKKFEASIFEKSE